MSSDIAIDPEQYEPRYVRLNSIPIEVQDNYTSSEKRIALFNAETDLELDRTGGERIPDDDVTSAHVHAVLNLATYYLVRSATSPSDVTLGELQDGGDQKENHAKQYYDTYVELIEKIAQAQKGQPGTYFGHTGDPGRVISVNTGGNSRRHDLDTPVEASDFANVAHERFTTRRG